MFRPTALDHIVLRVTDVNAMLAFYVAALGCTPDRMRPELGLYQVRAGNSLIDLVPIDGPLGRRGGAAPGREGRNLDHLCLRIEPFDVEAIRAWLLARDIRPGPVESRYGAQGSGPSLYVTDPEGNVVELKGPADTGAPGS